MLSKSPDRRLMPRSITTRLTLLYSGCVLLILLLSLVAVYATLDASFDREDDDFWPAESRW